MGPKKAREMWFLARFYTAQEAEKMGLINTVVPVSSFSLKQYPSMHVFSGSGKGPGG